MFVLNVLLAIIFLFFSDYTFGKNNISREKILASCPRNSKFFNCSNVCPEKTCYSNKLTNLCFSLRCGKPKCQCKYGYVRLSGPDSPCVKPIKCMNRKKSKL
uniref:TIL domain-containing protein n=1 Tax=Strongyloides stercoralis TaxID=6248 RepID=A0A0K0EAU7_STRER